MNKELINKHKLEFDHWLAGGELLCYTEVDGPYHPVDETYWDYPADIGFIINDEYVELRKALAEGKTIQYNTKVNYPTVGGWEDSDKPLFNGVNPTSSYRIKPDEPKFKAGDWVRIVGINKITRIPTNHSTSTELSCIEFSGQQYFLSDIELWQPKSGEWCWFWDNQDLIPDLERFTEMKYDGSFGHNNIDHRYSSVYCEPYPGPLPTNIKE